MYSRNSRSYFRAASNRGRPRNTRGDILASVISPGHRCGGEIPGPRTCARRLSAPRDCGQPPAKRLLRTPLIITRAQPSASLRRSRGREITRGLWRRVTHVDSCDSVSAHSARDIKSTSRYLGSSSSLSRVTRIFRARFRGAGTVACAVCGGSVFIHSFKCGKYKYF